MITCSKVFPEIPFAHRQPNHKGHCRFIHGHNWTIKLTFVADRLDDCGFVMDFGDCKEIKQMLITEFDHALVLNVGDHILNELPGNSAVRSNAFKLTTVPDCSCEGLAKYFQDRCDEIVSKKTECRVRVLSCTVDEDSRNSATFSIPNPFAPKDTA